MKKSVWKSLLLGIICVVGIFGWVGVIASVKIFVTPWWRIPCVALIVALALMGPLERLWTKITDMRNRYLARLLAVAMYSGVFAGVGLIVNFCFERPDTSVQTERHAITRLYRTEHQNRRRVGRRYVATGTVSYRYHAELDVDGRAVEVPVSFGQYRKLRAGRDSLNIDIHHGVFGGDFVTLSRRSKLK